MLKAGHRIRELRRAQKLTIMELADMLGVSGPSVYFWEHYRSYPSLQNAIVMADFFGVSLDYLVGREFVPKSPQDAAQYAKR